MSKAQVISTKDDFPHLQVWRQERATGPLLAVVFKNREARTAGWDTVWGLGSLTLLTAGLVPIIAYFSNWTAVAIIAVLLVILIRMIRPVWVRRAIELDFGAKALRVLKNGRVKLTRPLASLQNLTIEPHPQVEAEMRRNPGKIGPKQKQHCLFGWFGAGGGDKVLLVSRFEWPSQESLFEVRQAVIWALRQADGAPLPEEAGAPRSAEREATQKPADIKPPLD